MPSWGEEFGDSVARANLAQAAEAGNDLRDLLAGFPPEILKGARHNP